MTLEPGLAASVPASTSVGGAVAEVVVVLDTRRFVMLAEQITSAPPPFVEPLHWLMVTLCDEGVVPVAVQVSPTSVPPLAEPWHWVIVAPVVVAGNGSQPVVIPPPEPTHWLTVAPVAPVLRP